MKSPAPQFSRSGTNAAILVTRKGDQLSQTVKRFTDPHAALDWCIKRKAGFVYAAGGDALMPTLGHN